MATQPLDPSIIVIFGITGDLSQRYLLPALYHLIKQNYLGEQTQIVGVTRRDTTVDQLFEEVEICVNEIDKVCDPVAIGKMRQQTRMLRLDLDNVEDYKQLQQTLQQIEDQAGLCLNRLFYLSIPPQVYPGVVKLMGQAGLQKSCAHGQAPSRLLIEKPFGYDLTSAQQLIEQTTAVFQEEQIFRIDHYLAKETVQNILTFRFENPIFEPIWSSQYISQIEISAAEQIGIVGRAHFYDPVGALRDFIQSHLIQLLGLVTMDRPEALNSHQIHQAKQAVLEQAQAARPEQAIRAQYEGYRQEVDNPDSNTETFAAIQLTITSERWRDVPILIWTGKALAQKETRICVTFKDEAGQTNQLRFRIQPNEGIELGLQAKRPGFDHELHPVSMNFDYQQALAEHEQPNAYERVLVDAVRGDRTLFATSQEVLASWRIVEPVIAAWRSSGDGLKTYQQGAQPDSLLY